MQQHRGAHAGVGAGADAGGEVIEIGEGCAGVVPACGEVIGAFAVYGLLEAGNGSWWGSLQKLRINGLFILFWCFCKCVCAVLEHDT